MESFVNESLGEAEGKISNTEILYGSAEDSMLKVCKQPLVWSWIMMQEIFRNLNVAFLWPSQ